MPTATTGPYPLKDVRMPSWLLRFDKRGACISPATRQQLVQQLRSAPPSDIIVFSHGWNNDFDAAIGMYAEFLRQLETLCVAHPPGRRFDPLFVGVLWPSIWMSFDNGPAIASAGSPFGQAEVALAELADRVAATGGAASLERVYALLAAPAIDDADAAELARLIAPAFGLVGDEGAAVQARDTFADDVLMMMRAMESAVPSAEPPLPDDIDDFSRPARAGAATGAGGADGPGSAYGPRGAGGAGATGATGAMPMDLRTAGVPALLDPRNALRLFSLYQMKDRSGTVGFNGVGALLRDVLAIAGNADASAQPRVHAVGHSFGCKVLLSAICAQPLPRPVASLLLLQPALSHLCFADAVPGTGAPGGYRSALLAERVTPPIVSTYSRNDVPLHDVFHWAVWRAQDLGEAQIAAGGEATSAGPPPSRYAALGGYGPRHAGERLVDGLPAVGSAFELPAEGVPIVAFDGSRGGIQRHGDITGPALAWALHRLVFR